MGIEEASTGPHLGSPGGSPVRDVVRDVVAEVAPRELVIIDGLEGFSDAKALRRLGDRRRRSDPLGFGPDEFVAFVTPLVWIVLNEIATRGASVAVDGGQKGLKGLWGRVFRRNRARRELLPKMSSEELDRVRTKVLDELKRAGIKERRATAVADAVLRRLMFDDPPDSDEPPDDSDPEKR